MYFILLMDDFNAKVGKDPFPGLIETFGEERLMILAHFSNRTIVQHIFTVQKIKTESYCSQEDKLPSKII